MPIFYIRFNPSGEQYARREGNTAADWEQAFFDDLFESKASELRYLTEEATPGIEPYSWVIGKRWVHKARIDARRGADTLFVFEFKDRQKRFRNGLPRIPLALKGDFRHLKATATSPPPRGDDLPAALRPPTAVPNSSTLTPVPPPPEPQPPRPEPAGLNAHLFFGLMEHLVHWPSESILPEYASASLLDSGVLLARLQAFLQKSAQYQVCLPTAVTQRQRLLLAGNATAAPEEIGALHELFGAIFLEKLGQLLGEPIHTALLVHVAEFLRLPPPDGLFQQFVFGWITRAPKEGRLPRVLAAVQWLERPHQGDQRTKWLSILTEAAKQGKVRRPPSAGSWEQFTKWLGEQLPMARSPESVPAPVIAEAPRSEPPPLPPASAALQPVGYPAEMASVGLADAAMPPAIDLEEGVTGPISSPAALAVEENDFAQPGGVQATNPPETTSPTAGTLPESSSALRYESLCELVLREVFPHQNRVRLQLEIQQLIKQSAALAKTGTTASSPEVLLALRTELEAHTASVSSALSQLPTQQELLEANDQLGSTLRRLDALPSQLGDLLGLSQLGSLEELLVILKLLEHPLLGALPDWFLAELSRCSSAADYREVLAQIVLQPPLRERLEGVLVALGEPLPLSVEEQQRLRLAKRPSVAPADSVAALRTALDVLRGRQVSIENYTDLGPWVEREWRAQSGIERQRLLLRDLNRMEAELHRFRGQVGDRVWFELSDEIRAADSMLAAQTLIPKWSDWFKRIPSSALRRMPDLETISALVAGEETDKLPIQKPIEIDHCISSQTDDTGDWRVQQAQLCASPDPSDPRRYVCSIPIYVKWFEPRTITISLTLDVTYSIGRMRTDRDGPFERQTHMREIEIHRDAWWPLRGGRYAASCIVKDVPIAHVTHPERYQSVTEMTIKFGGYAHRINIPVAYKLLHWALPSAVFPKIPVLKFKTTTTPEEMQTHPLGMQGDYQTVLDFVRAGYASFMISAPRRYGKTTLIDAVAQQLSSESSTVLAIGPIKVTSCRPLMDSEAAFREALRLLCTHVRLNPKDTAMLSDHWDGELVPEAEVFLEICRRAKAKGINAIYLLFDEAQAMFLGHRGRLACEYIKSLIEDKRIDGSNSEYAALHIGLIGQAHMPRLLVGQLAEGLRRPAPNTEVTEHQIQVLVKALTANILQSTAEARDYLRKVSYNFFTLTEILDEVRRHIISLNRTWFLRSDIEVAADNLVRRALEPNSQLVSTLRDYLNESDDLKEWRPIVAYPVALALAKVLEERRQMGSFSFGDPLDDVSKLLNKWTQKEHPAWEIPRERIQQGLLDLEEASVLDGQHRFLSPVLQRYLAGLATNELKFRDDLERRTLHALAVDMVRLPEVLEPIRSGGQAQVFEAEYDNRRCAVRLAELKTEADSKHFIDTCYTLQRLYASKTKLVGQECLPVLRALGLTRDSPRRGVIIYDYIEGTDLSDEKGRFSDAAVVNLGRQLAAVVEILKIRDVVHCDIRPQNILRSEANARPYLVDFGLARHGDHSRNAAAAQTDEYAAPETLGAQGRFSAQSDVYALGQTLRKLRRNDDPDTPLGKALAVALHPDPSLRATPEGLRELLEGLHQAMRIQQLHQAARQEFEELLRRVQPESSRRVAERHIEHMEATRMGMFHGVVAAAQAAQLVDELFGDFYASNYPKGALRNISNERERPHLTLFDPEHSDTIPEHLRRYRELVADETRSTGLLRHANAHGERFLKKKSEALSVLNRRENRFRGNPADESIQLWSAVVITAQRMERLLQLRGLGALIELWRDSAMQN